MKLQIDMMQDTIEENERSIIKLNDQINALQNENKSLKEKLAKSNNEIDKLKKTLIEKEERQVALSIQKSLNTLKQKNINTSRTISHTKVILILTHRIRHIHKPVLTLNLDTVI